MIQHAVIEIIPWLTYYMDIHFGMLTFSMNVGLCMKQVLEQDDRKLVWKNSFTSAIINCLGMNRNSNYANVQHQRPRKTTESVQICRLLGVRSLTHACTISAPRFSFKPVSHSGWPILPTWKFSLLFSVLLLIIWETEPSCSFRNRARGYFKHLRMRSQGVRYWQR